MTNPLAADLDLILDHTRDLWEELRGNRLFITGGTGFFGTWLVESFCRANHRLGLNAQAVVLTRNPAGFEAKAPHLVRDTAVRLHTGDVRDFPFPAGGFSHVIHAATAASAVLNREEPPLMLDTIMQGTRHTLDFAVQAHAAKFLLTSSGAVYGPQPADMPRLSESWPGGPDTMQPDAVYGEGKRVAELLCAIYRRQFGLHTNIARCFAFVGPHLPLDTHFAIGNFIRDQMTGRAIQVRGDGRPLRSYLYAADLCIWLWTILCRGVPCRPYNVGSEEALSIADVAATVSACGGRTGEVEIGQHGVADQDEPRQRYIPSTARAREELGLQVFTSLPTAIDKTIAWNRRFTPVAR